MAWTGLALTVEGRNALNRAQASGKLNFKSIVVGDGNAPANFSTTRQLVHQLYELDQLMVEVAGDNCTLTADFPDVDYDYYFRELGVMVTTDEGDKLYVYDNCGDDAQCIISTSGVESTRKRIRLVLQISDVTEVTVSKPELLYVTYKEMQENRAELENELDNHAGSHENPHQVNKEQIGLGKVDNTSDTDKPVSKAQQKALDALADAVGEKAGTVDFENHVKDAIKHVTSVERDKWNNGSSTYGTCATAANTVAKTVACAGFKLTAGAEIAVKFTVTNTASKPTLNVNNTGAKPIYYRGAAISAGYLAAGRTYEFRYNGAQWELVGDINTNTTYNAMTKATESAAGKAGLVPAPEAGAQGKYLTGAGTWQNVDDHTVVFTSNDVESPAAWQGMSLLKSGDTLKGIFNKLSTAVRNVRWLYKMLGTTDISKIGGGTVTGAINELNTDIVALAEVSQHETTYGTLYVYGNRTCQFNIPAGVTISNGALLLDKNLSIYRPKVPVYTLICAGNAFYNTILSVDGKFSILAQGENMGVPLPNNVSNFPSIKTIRWSY